MCFFSSLPGVADDLDSDTKYYMALVGQALTGVACPFISCVPTKISQHWFGDTQRTIATIVLGMANPLGIVLGQASHNNVQRSICIKIIFVLLTYRA